MTAKYSAAPDAQNLYDPRKQGSVPNPIAKPPQPFEQRYTPPPPQQAGQYPPQQQSAQSYPQPMTMQNPNLMDSAPYPPQSAFPSQGMPPVDLIEDEGFDYVTLALGILAALAVVGLVFLWIFVIVSL